MVYCGRPSTGCYACRERKSRCDQLPEGCTQCLKAKRICPGYRQLGDVIFHNESDNVVRKIKAKEARLKAKRVADQGMVTDGLPCTPRLASEPATLRDVNIKRDVCNGNPSQAPLTLVELKPTIEDRATGYFATNFVFNSEGARFYQLDYVSDIQRNSAVDEGMISSMRAIGFAGYAYATRNLQLLKDARAQYAKALQYTNDALTSPETATKDSTLLSILLLGLYETVTGSQQRSLRDWFRHVNGAAAVVRMRGKQQVKTYPGRRMLLQVTTNVLITCLVLGKALPSFLRDLIDEAMRATSLDVSTGFIIHTTSVKVAALRADILSGRLTDLRTILIQAVELESLLLEICENPYPGWEYKTVYTEVESSLIYKGQYHIYSDCWLAQLWNAMRVNRIILNETIREVLLKGFASCPPIFTEPIHTAQFQLSTDTIYSLQQDILSSVANHVIPFTKNDASNPDPKQDFATIFRKYDAGTLDFYSLIMGMNVSSTEVPMMRIYGGVFLIWPLFSAGSLGLATEEVKAFVIRNLRAVSKATGIQQGNALAELLETGSEANVHFI